MGTVAGISQKSEPPLSRKVDWEVSTTRMFSNDPHKAIISITTSWIPGENRKGIVRYRVFISTGFPSAEEWRNYTHVYTNDAFLRRLSYCTYVIEFDDPDGFALRKSSFAFTLMGDGESHIIGLEANASTSMTAAEYRLLIGEDGKSGTWSLASSCTS